MATLCMLIMQTCPPGRSPLIKIMRYANVQARMHWRRCPQSRTSDTSQQDTVTTKYASPDNGQGLATTLMALPVCKRALSK